MDGVQWYRISPPRYVFQFLPVEIPRAISGFQTSVFQVEAVLAEVSAWLALRNLTRPPVTFAGVAQTSPDSDCSLTSPDVSTIWSDEVQRGSVCLRLYLIWSNEARLDLVSDWPSYSSLLLLVLRLSPIVLDQFQFVPTGLCATATESDLLAASSLLLSAPVAEDDLIYLNPFLSDVPTEEYSSTLDIVDIPLPATSPEVSDYPPPPVTSSLPSLIPSTPLVYSRRRAASPIPSSSSMTPSSDSGNPDPPAQSYKEACNDPHWVDAMNDELTALAKTQIWELTPLPDDKNLIGCK
ncbi:hypothetical protein Acr_24g0007530 [Actinidia rufa]|uniref:Uncharacterized protein n=1 Tax=Actinidia rufa TaxID=165716 RepID=A0A7J0GUU8_9ERIC|nr:hypothetical protein Acr_24g0007530 [Actinidia rufa]